MKKREDPVTHDLRDRPVPPVKGAVTEHEPARPRPEQAAELGLLNRLQ